MTATKFRISELSNFTLLSQPRIKMILGIPLAEKCLAINLYQVKEAYAVAEKGSEKQMAALIRWQEIYDWQVNLYAGNEAELKALYFNSPPEQAEARVKALKQLAYFYGYTNTLVCEEQLNGAADLETALRRSFDFLPPSNTFIGPKGRIKLLRNSVPKGNRGVAEVAVLENLEDRHVLFCATWSNGEFKLQPKWAEKIQDWNDKW